MKYSGLYFISNPSTLIAGSEALSVSISASVESNWPRANREDGGWTLNHRLLRDLPSHEQMADENWTHSYQHLLRLSFLSSNRAYNLLQPPPSAAETSGLVTSIPADQLESHCVLLANQWAQLWSSLRAHDIASNVPGITYTTGEFVIRIGEVRSRRSGPHTASSLSPGVVVCITTNAGSPDNDPEFSDFEEEVDFDDVQNQIREVWKNIKQKVDSGKSDIGEFMQEAHDVSGNGEKEREAVVRMWCEALRR